MEYDDWRWLFAVISSERHYEVDDVFYHTADNNVTLGEHRVFHGLEYDVLFIDTLGSSLAKI